MADDEPKVAVCSSPGCDQPGTSSCASCKLVGYCGRICQVADWPNHRESCPGHLRKMGISHLQKAKVYDNECNFTEQLRYAELALTKLKQLKDRSLETVEVLDEALDMKFTALNFMDRNKEALECATERYNMWATTYMRNSRTIEASFSLLESLINNKEFAQAHLIAGTVYEMILRPMTHDIPENKQQSFLADGTYYLARATCGLAEAGGIPPEEKQKAGEEAITLALKALEMQTQLNGTVGDNITSVVDVISDLLAYFNDSEDEGTIRVWQQVIATVRQVNDGLSLDTGRSEHNLGLLYIERAVKAQSSEDWDRVLACGDLALLRLREAVRIYKAIERTGMVEDAAQLAHEAAKLIENVEGGKLNARKALLRLRKSAK